MFLVCLRQINVLFFFSQIRSALLLLQDQCVHSVIRQISVLSELETDQCSLLLFPDQINSSSCAWDRSVFLVCLRQTDQCSYILCVLEINQCSLLLLPDQINSSYCTNVREPAQQHGFWTVEVSINPQKQYELSHEFWTVVYHAIACNYHGFWTVSYQLWIV